MDDSNFPNRPIRIFAAGPGGSQDYAARFLCPALSKELGQEVTAELGESGYVPAVKVMAEPADGHALLLSGRLLWLMQLIRDDAPFDLLRDFTPLVHTTSGTQVLVVRPDLPANDIRELIALAKSKPGQLAYASSKAGGNNHLAPELFKKMAGVDIKCREYRNSAERFAALQKNEVQMFFTGICSFAKELKAGTLKPLGLTCQQRSALYPELPTIAEAGVPGYENITAGALFALSKTPAPILRRLSEAATRVMQSPEAKEYFSREGYEAVGASGDALVRLMKADLDRVGKLIKELGITALTE